MRAVVAPEPGGPEALRIVDRPVPEHGPDDLLVAVRATAVNRADLLQREGRYPPPPGAPDVLGLELAGEVVAVGEAAAGWEIGDRVCSIVAGGGYAEWAVVPGSTALPVPDRLTFDEAAALPEAFATAYDNLLIRGRLQTGETGLIHGGASGVGTAAIQLAARAGARVFVTAGSDGKLEACAELGATVGINYREEDFVEAVARVTGGRGVDVILDIVGGPYLERNLRSLATEGRLVIIGTMGGASAELPLGLLLTRRLTVTASTLRGRSVAEKAALAATLATDVWPRLVDGSLGPVVDRVFPLDQVAEAHRRVEASEHVGKVVLRVAAQGPTCTDR